ncbi:peptidylprolyl isomerase [Granulicatella elegans]|uniref:peptidylprolyl isomerase n=1 Tax=Granulicatella elegans TaxID=137732 RepID=UPI0028D88070|nr:peptidylprolyl isomerase [Granulicatella elegans]
MKKTMMGMLAVASTLALAACSNNQSAVATSKAGNVTQEEFYKALKTTSGEQTLQRLVLQKVLENDVKDKKALEEEVKKEVANQVTQYGGEDALKAVLARSGFNSVDAYRETVYLNKLITVAVKKANKFSDEEIQKYYDSWEPKATAQHILIGVAQNASDEEKAEAKKKAEDLIKQLKDGADFDTLAKENSTDKSSAENGGKIGPFRRAEMVKEFADAAYGLKVGEITEEPVLTQYGYHIIKLVEKPEKGSLNDLRSTLEDELIAEKLKDTATIHSVVSSLVKEADVKITDDTLKNALKDFSDNTPNVTEQSQTTGN